VKARQGAHADTHFFNQQARVAVGVHVDQAAGGDGVGVKRSNGFEGIRLSTEVVADAVELIGEGEHADTIARASGKGLLAYS
jgi:hypothetical protein